MLCALLAVAAVSVQDPLPQNGELKPFSGALYLGGGLGIEFSVSFTFEKTIPTGRGLLCTRACRGSKHIVHSDCDGSCDAACTDLHRYEIAASGANYSGTTGRIPVGDPRKAQATFDMLSQRINEQVRRLPKVKLNLRHWNQAHCSEQSRYVKYNTYRAAANIKLFEEVRNAEGGVQDRKVVNEASDVAIAHIRVPTEQYEDSAPAIKCACSVVQEIKPDGNFLAPATGAGSDVGPGKPTTGTTGGTGTGQSGKSFDPYDKSDMMGKRASMFDLGIYAGGAYTTDWFEIGEDPPLELPSAIGSGYFYIPGTETAIKIGNYVPFGGNVANQFELDVKLDDMVGGSITGSNPFPTPFNIYLPAGTTFDTDENDTQDCVLVAPMTLSLPPPPPPSGLWASLEEWPEQRRGQKMTAKVRVMCLEISKAEPTPSTKYKIRPPLDRTMAKIGQQISKSRMRGPWDQAKVWAYMDGATHDQIVKKLIPSPRIGAFGRSLFELAQAGVDFSNTKYAKLIEPKLITQFGSEKATFWLTQRVADNPTALEAWAKNGAAEMLPLLDGQYPEDKVHFARVVDILAWRPEPECQRTALAILAAVPDSSRGALKDANLMPVWMLCLSPDKAIAKEAQRLLDIFSPPEMEMIKLNAGKS